MRAKLLAVAAGVLFLACGDRKSGESSETEAPAGAAARPGDAGARAEPPPDAARRAPREKKKVVLDARKRREFRRLTREGSRAQKRDDWAAAVAAYEAALAIDPSSARVFSELSWAAFKAEDHQKAVEAARSSVALAVSPDLQGASLYNLGRALEGAGDEEGAVAAYVESLRVRPNQAVRKRLLGLGGTPPVATSPDPLCPTRGDKAQLCRCLKKDVKDEEAVCSAEDRVAGSLRLWGVGYGGGREYRERLYLVSERDGGYAQATPIGDVIDAPYAMSELELTKFEVEERAGRKLYRALVSMRKWAEGSVVESLDEKRLTLCVEEGETVRCPLTVPIERSFSADVYDADDADAVAEFKREYRAAPPLGRAHRLKVSVGDDGKVLVELKSGARTSELKRFIGEHRLW